MKSSLNLTVVLVLLSLIAAPGEAGDSFYKETPLFPTAPRETASSQLVARFGPVGIGIELGVKRCQNCFSS